MKNSLASQCDIYNRYSTTSASVEKLGVSPSYGSGRCAGHSDFYSPTPAGLSFVHRLLRAFLDPSLAIMREVMSDPSSHSVEEWRRATKTVFYCLRGCTYVLLDENEGSVAALSPVEAMIEGLLASAPAEASNYIRPLRGSLCRFLGDCLRSINASLATATSSHEFQRDPKATKYILQCTSILMVHRGKKAGTVHSAKQSLRAIRNYYGNDVLYERAHSSLVARLRTGELASRPVYSDGEEQGKSSDWRTICSRVAVHLLSLFGAAAVDVPKRHRLQRSEGNEVAARVLNGYESLLNGAMGLSGHPYTKIANESFAAVNKVTPYYTFLANVRIPRLLSALDFSDGAEEFRAISESGHCYGIPIFADLPDDECGNTRLGEVAMGVIVSMFSRLKAVIDNKEHFYNVIKKYVTIEVHIVSRLDQQQKQKMLEMLNRVFAAIRQRWWFDNRFVKDEEKRAHRECIDHLVGLLAVPGGGGAGGDGKAGSPASPAEGFNWRNKLTVCWFLTNLVGPEEAKDQPLMLTLGEVSMNMIAGSVSGLPIQRCALGLLGRLVSRDLAMREDCAIEGREAAETGELFRGAVAARMGQKGEREEGGERREEGERERERELVKGGS